MDTLLIFAGILLIIVGFIGSFLPVLPGPPASWFAILLLHLSKYADFSTTYLTVTALVVVIVTVVDYIFPTWLTKKAGGSKAGIWGATIGLVVGIFVFPPIGIILGPALGAFIGEMMYQKDSNRAITSALAAFAAFILGTGLKLIVCGYFAWEFVVNIIVK